MRKMKNSITQILKNKKGNVRSIDVAHELMVSKPSVSVAMKNFREEGYVAAGIGQTNGNLLRTCDGKINFTVEGSDYLGHVIR